jgi:hypothetical protein
MRDMILSADMILDGVVGQFEAVGPGCAVS